MTVFISGIAPKCPQKVAIYVSIDIKDKYSYIRFKKLSYLNV